MAGLFKVPNRMEDLALFTRHVAGAMNARVPLPEILRAYASDSEHGALATASAAMANRVEAGEELSGAMEQHPKLFSAAYRRLVRLGEQSRTLGGVMNQLADSLEESLKTYEYFRRAAIYPLLVIILLFLDLCFLAVFITPKFQDIFHMLSGSMPGLLGSPQFIKGLVLAFALLLLVPIAYLIAAMMGLRVNFAGSGRMALSLPLVGPVMRRAETARFAHHLGLLLGNRIPLAESLGLLADASENAYVRSAVQDFHARYQQGERLGEMIGSQPLFPSSMAVMVSAAEDQGGLAETMRHLGRFYAERTAHGLTILREVFEPVLLLLIGLLVALILLSLYYPLFEIPKMIR